MNKLFLGKALLALVFFLPVPVMAGVNVDVHISLPPPIVFAAPPALIVLPETYVYVVPDAEVDIFFFDGWWWRPWEGRWYRSQFYDSGWRHYRSVPSFYVQVPSRWRDDYRDRRWRGQKWDHRPIPHEQVKRNWDGWKRNKHWEKQNTWGVSGLKPQSQSKPPTGAVQPKHQTVQPRDHEQPRDVHTQKRSPQAQPAPNVRERTKPQSSRQPSRQLQKQAPKQHEQERSKSQPGKQKKERKEKKDK